MRRPRFRSAVRSLLEYIGEGLIWTGMTWGGYPWDGPWECPDRLSGTEMSEAERAEWAALVKRLR